MIQRKGKKNGNQQNGQLKGKQPGNKQDDTA